MKTKSSMILVITLFMALNFPFSAIGFEQDRLTGNQSREAEVSEKLQDSKPVLRTIPTRPISLIIEEGYLLPSQVLAKIKAKEAPEITSVQDLSILNKSIDVPEEVETNSPLDVIFTVSEGSARFQNTEGFIARKSVANGVIVTPNIVPGPTNDESFINVLVGGKTIIDNLRIATLSAGGIKDLLRYISVGDPALIILGDHYAVIDENKLTNITDETITKSSRVPGGKKKSDDAFATQGLCIRTPSAPGRVNWYINNPRGAGFSVKPEGPLELIWASTPSNAIDGIYNRNWGCGVALKVPDSCTINWYSSSYSYCCNAFFASLGYVPKWVNPGNIGWKNCPLR